MKQSPSAEPTREVDVVVGSGHNGLVSAAYLAKAGLDGLFLTGSRTHPVAGISGMPGHNAARTILKVLGREHKGDRLAALAEKHQAERARRTARPVAGSRGYDYTGGQNNPFPAGPPGSAVEARSAESERTAAEA